MAVHLSALLLRFFPPSLLLPLFQSLEKLLHLSPLPHPLSLALPHLLKGCGHLSLPHPQRVSLLESTLSLLTFNLSPSQSAVLDIITILFQTLLHGSSWLTQHFTLDAFKSFAEVKNCRMLSIAVTDASFDQSEHSLWRSSGEMHS